MSKPTIVITGSALATSLGIDRETTWKNVLAGKSGFGPLTALESPLPAGKDGSQAAELPADYYPNLPREARYLRWTMSAAMSDAGLKADTLPYDPPRCAIILGTTLHGMRAGGRFLRSNDFADLKSFNAGATLSLAVDDHPFAGAGMTICSACSSSLGSIAMAITQLQNGQADCIIAGGYDTISEYVYGGFNSLRLVADGPLRPFARDRKGMKLGEGYGIVILERAEDAKRRGRANVTPILGWGESADAHHLTQPHPQGEGAARAISAALERAGVSPESIDLIAAHATGTPDNDAGEFAAMSRVFGGELARIPVVGFKSHLGHTLGGAGAVELILSSLALRDQLVPACANVQQDEIEFPGINVSTGCSRIGKVGRTLNTSLGFGGANTCVVLGRDTNTADPSHTTESTPTRLNASSNQTPVLISGVGVIAPGIIGIDALLARSPEPRSLLDSLGPVPDADLEALLNARRTRRMSQYVKLQLAAVALACRHAGLDLTETGGNWRDRACAVLGTTHGGANYSWQYYGQIVREGIAGANPMLFAEGVPNAGAAHVSLMLGLKGACQSVIGTRTAGLDALALAASRIAAGDWDCAIVGAGEEYCELIRSVYQQCGIAKSPANGSAGDADGFHCGSGGVAFVLESPRALAARGGKAIGRFEAAASARVSRSHMAAAGAQLLRTIGSPRQAILAGSGSRLDAIELAALQQAGVETASSVYGHVTESFSATPLIGLAAALAGGRLLPWIGPRVGGESIRLADGSEVTKSLAAISSDPTGAMTAVRVTVGE